MFPRQNMENQSLLTIGAMMKSAGCQLVQKDQICHHSSIVDQVGNAVNDTKIHTSFFDHLLIGTGFFCVHVGHQNFMGPRKEDPQIQQISGQGNSQEKACMGRT